ncbi:hypothetical protein JXD38_11865 [candidate division WOR-3 bacterium]|nr:hypothetical protein [candidate division WOR-3 bacterium]
MHRPLNKATRVCRLPGRAGSFSTGIASTLLRRLGFQPGPARTFRFLVSAIFSTPIQIEGGFNHALP